MKRHVLLNEVQFKLLDLTANIPVIGNLWYLKSRARLQ